MTLMGRRLKAISSTFRFPSPPASDAGVSSLHFSQVFVRYPSSLVSAWTTRLLLLFALFQFPLLASFCLSSLLHSFSLVVSLHFFALTHLFVPPCPVTFLSSASPPVSASPPLLGAHEHLITCVVCVGLLPIQKLLELCIWCKCFLWLCCLSLCPLWSCCYFYPRCYSCSCNSLWP
jgi:hypothetical protein